VPVLALLFAGNALSPSAEAGRVLAGSQASQEPAPSPEWIELEREFAASWQAHQAAIQQAQQAGVPPANWPTSPAQTYWDRCAEFAARGEVAAIRGCIGYSEGLSLSPEGKNQRRLVLYRGGAKHLPEGPGLREVMRAVQSELHPSRRGPATVAALCAEIADRVKDGALRGVARASEGLALLAIGGPGNVERARQRITGAIEDDPDGELVAKAKGRLFQMDRLQVGMACPDFTAKDVDGIEFKRSDYLGKVVVLDFWGFW
jgi:hypothetical protein